MTGNTRQPSEAMVVLTPEHQRVFADAGWTKQQFHDELAARLVIDPSIAEAGISGGAVPEGGTPKFRPGSLLVVRTGGDAGSLDGRAMVTNSHSICTILTRAPRAVRPTPPSA